MIHFLEKVEKAMLSEDPFVQDYAFDILNDSYLATQDTFRVALKAYDAERKTPLHSPVLPKMDFISVDEKNIEEIIQRLNQLQKTDEDHIWYLRILSKASTDLLLQFQKQLQPFIHKEFFQNLQRIKTLDEEGLFMELAEIMVRLEEQFDQSVFDFGKRIADELILRNDIPQWEVENGIRNDLEEDEYIQYDGVFNIYMAGELRLESVIPDLFQILTRDEGDIVKDEATKALIKIGTNEVVIAAEKYALDEEADFYCIDILEKIKTKSAEQALLRLFDQTKDITLKTLIADALCQHLSTEAIPKVKKLIVSGYDAMMLNLEESLYANLVINEINDPWIPQLKQELEQEKREILEHQKRINSMPAQAKKQKVGRNDPCPCGSGKKYKKCCL